jgi:hypothetical protein
MKSPKYIKTLIRNTKICSNPEVNQAVLKDLLKQIDHTETQKPAASLPNIRRTIMKNRITKLAITAAVIAVLVLGLFEFVGTQSTSGVVWADVAQKVQASRDIIFRTVRHDTPDPYGGGVDFSIDHYSSTQARLDRYKGGKIVSTMYDDCNTKTVIMVDYVHKSYVKDTDVEGIPDSFRWDPNRWVKKFLSCKYKKLGQKTIDGALCEGIETTDPTFSTYDDPSESLTARIWVSMETGYPVQCEAEYVRHNGEIRFKIVQDQFQWDVELDESIFEPNIPAGYIDISP